MSILHPIQLISVVFAVYNEESGIASFISEIEKQVTGTLELIIVDDGSSDCTAEEVRACPVRPETRKRLVRLSRNFGHHAALFAGLELVSPEADAVVVMDADFQDDPADIAKLIAELQQGFDCVYAVRAPRSSSALVDGFTFLFYRLQTVLSSFPIPRHAGTFCVFRQNFLKQLLRFKEVDVYFPGLRAYVGLSQRGVTVERGSRRHGTSRVRLLGLLRLSITGLLGFSAVPMRAIFVSGALLTALCMLLGLGLLLFRIFTPRSEFILTPLAVLILMLFGIQMTFLGVVGEYVGKLFIESKRRPRSIVAEILDE